MERRGAFSPSPSKESDMNVCQVMHHGLTAHFLIHNTVAQLLQYVVDLPHLGTGSASGITVGFKVASLY